MMTAAGTPTSMALPGYVDRTVVGTRAEVAAVLGATVDSGRLVALTPPRRVAGDDLRVYMRMRLLAPTPPSVPVSVSQRTAARQNPRRPWRIAAVATVAAVGVTVLGGLVYVVWLLAQAVVALLPMLVGVLVVLALLWLALGRVGVCCPGLHCPGCRH